MSDATNSGIKTAWPPPPDNWRLADNEIHIRAIPLDAPVAEVSDFAAVLSSDEQARADRFHFERDRDRFIVARGAMRLLLGCCCALAPAALRFEYGSRGKPSLAAGISPTPLHFNLAHSGALALLAVTRVGEVGVDVERIRAIQDADGIAERFFSARETAVLRSLPAREREAAFFKLWTRKEAWLKATGEGIGDGLNRVEVTCLPDEPARITCLGGDPEAATQWSLSHLEPGEDYVGALATRARDAELRCWRFNSSF